MMSLSPEYHPYKFEDNRLDQHEHAYIMKQRFTYEAKMVQQKL